MALFLVNLIHSFLRYCITWIGFGGLIMVAASVPDIFAIGGGILDGISGNAKDIDPNKTYDFSSVPTYTTFDIVMSTLFLLPLVMAPILWFTGLWEVIMRWVLNCRRMLNKEKARLQPLWDEVRRKAEEKSGEDFSKVELFMVDDPTANAFALGRKTVSINTGLLNRHTDDEILAVLAHECGHLVYGDPSKSGISHAIDSEALVFERFLVRFYVLYKVPVLGVIVALIMLPYLICSWLFVAVDYVHHWLSMLLSRKAEFRADKFAYDLGYGHGLHNILDGWREANTPQAGFLAKLYKSHPDPAKRMLRLESYG